jgi:hypothetical protein
MVYTSQQNQAWGEDCLTQDHTFYMTADVFSGSGQIHRHAPAGIFAKYQLRDPERRKISEGAGIL